MGLRHDPIYAFAADPTATDDSTAGYLPGDDWKNTSSGEVFMCIDNTATAAVWKSLTNALNGVIQGPFILNQVVSPTALAANTNDWSITDLKDNNVIFASTTGGNYDVTGIVPTGVQNGQTFFFYNVNGSGGGDIKFKNNDAGSAAANRIITNGDAVVKDGMGVILTCDTAVSRWRVNYFK